MAGIYIHIPFCRQACHYCNFHFSTSLKLKNELISALLKEIELFRTSLPEAENIATIYIGGGTPSLCTPGELQSILQKIKDHFTVDSNAEITLEANPDDIHTGNLAAWQQAGINRLSLGIQSFFDEDLQWMNRAHNARQAKEAIHLALSHFTNITIDLIYGTPGLSTARWEENINRALATGIPHFSCYALTVEPKTALHTMIARHQRQDVDPDLQSEQFLLLMDKLEAAGYEQYEISNFAKPGYRSRHNASYWQGKNYYGFGPSAHSFDGQSRWWNIASNALYIKSIASGIIPFEKEMLTPVQQLNELIMISLRTNEGIDLAKMSVTERFPVLKAAAKYVQSGKMRREADRLILTREGKLLADGIAADLFL